MVLKAPTPFRELGKFESMVGSVGNDEAYEILKKVFVDLDEHMRDVG